VIAPTLVGAAKEGRNEMNRDVQSGRGGSLTTHVKHAVTGTDQLSCQYQHSSGGFSGRVRHANTPQGGDE